MSFIDHLEELRWHLIRSAIAVGILAIVAFFLMTKIYKYVILAPSQADFWTYEMLCQLSDVTCLGEVDFTLQNRTMAGQLTMHIIASLITGFIVAFPYIFFEIWSFIRPGLYPNEKKMSTGVVFVVTILFITGILFAYYIIAPMAIHFLANYRLDENIQNQIDITSYIGTLNIIVLAGGLMFQLPVVVYMLTRFGILYPALLKSYRKHAIVIIFLVAALITPSPDFLTQLLVAVPLYVLYEISIIVSAYTKRKMSRI